MRDIPNDKNTRQISSRGIVVEKPKKMMLTAKIERPKILTNLTFDDAF